MKRLQLARLLVFISNLLPKRYRIRHNSSEFSDPFFIFGSGRNGSTLLNVILNQHSKLFLPSEQYFLGNSIIKYQLYNYIVWRDLVKIIYGELIKQAENHSWDFSPNDIINEAFYFEESKRTMETLVHHIYSSYARLTKKKSTTWGDSTPYNTRYINEIYSCFPKAKYIFLIRDGRDVVAAYKKGGAGIFDHLADPATAAAHWIKAIKKYYWIKKRSDVLIVKYEELIQDTEKTLELILTFLGQEYQPSLGDFYKNVPKVSEYNQDHHKNLKKPISASSIGQWRELLTQEEKELITPGLTPYLQKFNYL